MQDKVQIVKPSAKLDKLSLQEYQEAFLYLYDEWIEADAFLESIGIPAQVEIDGEIETRGITQRIRLAINEAED